jgi:hypothetical protein
VEIDSVPAGGVVQFTDGTPIPQGKGIPTPVVQISQSRNNLPSLPTSTVLNAITNPLDNSGLFGTSAGTLLFKGAKETRVSTLNSNNWNLEYTFAYKPSRWDRMRKASGALTAIQYANGDPIFPTSNLGDLFM